MKTQDTYEAELRLARDLRVTDVPLKRLYFDRLAYALKRHGTKVEIKLNGEEGVLRGYDRVVDIITISVAGKLKTDRGLLVQWGSRMTAIDLDDIKALGPTYDASDEVWEDVINLHAAYKAVEAEQKEAANA